MKHINSISEIADNYNALILDIWGVIHDGEATYPNVLPCLEALRAEGKKICFLSNAPRRAGKVAAALNKFGITPNLYDHVMSSGEAAFHIIAKQEKAASKFIYIGPQKDRDLLDGSGFIETENAHEAAFAVATGFDNDDSVLAEKLPQIEACLAAKLKLYCVNPDLLVVRQDGTKMLCAGVIGEHYRDAGGETEFIGKPYAGVYERCFELLAGVEKARICAVGDNLETDIIGANQAGIDSVLCLGGVLKGEPTPLPELLAQHGCQPNYAIPSFCW